MRMRNERARGVAVIDISALPPPSTKSFLISPQSGHSVRGEEGKRVGAAVFRVRIGKRILGWEIMYVRIADDCSAALFESESNE